MKKRIFVFLITAIITASFTACSDKTAATSNSEQSSNVSVSQSSQESKEDSVNATELLVMKSFGELWMSDNFYIDVNMKVEYDASSVESSQSSSDSSSSGLKTIRYSFIIAEDRVNMVAGLNMISDLGSRCEILKDNYLYTIDHTNRTYSKKLYEGTADDYGSEYTTKILLGSVNNCVFENTGKTTYNGADVTFEKFKVTPSDEGTVDPSLKEVYMTYYFDSNGIPVAQVINTANGTTTFEFNRISDKIEVTDIIEIPKDYKEVSVE